MAETKNEAELAAEAEAKVKADAEAKAKAEADAKAQTVGEVLGTKPVEPPKEKLVPERDLMAIKAKKADLEREVEELKAKVAEGASKADVTATIDAIAEKHNIAKPFLRELANGLTAEIEAKFKKEAEVKAEKEKSEKEAKDREQENLTKAEQARKKFDDYWDKLIERMPEYKGIAQKESIRALSLDPANQSKSFEKILEESYGHLLQGKKGLEKTTPGAGKDSATVDFDKAARDTEYFQEIMSDPVRKKEYNDGLLHRTRKYL
jgi:hypothetical protein